MNIEISKQIQLSSLVLSDARQMLKLIENNRQTLGHYLPWVAAVTDIPSAEKFIDERVNNALPGAQWFKVIVNGELCGMFGIKSFDSETATAEVGYMLAEGMQGKGVISNIIIGMSGYIKDKIGAVIMEFRCLAPNQASINVALRAGAVLTQEIPDFIEQQGESQSLNVYQVRL
ncbi:GNAT family N-acetyltransferase [Amphritea sp. HPY]|uniref:GNAT family N-acetyltransferase n=1 Tax=Amphritea sp. HPY TaxID=3421652 RepID=UPI003D7C7F6F